MSSYGKNRKSYKINPTRNLAPLVNQNKTVCLFKTI